MLFTKSLRAKVLLSALIPGAIVLVAVAVIAVFGYQRTARQDIEQRDTELAKITAARLSEGLTVHRRILQNIAAQEDVHSMEPTRLGSALEEVQNQLFVFDGGVVIYDNEGTAVWSDPFSFERRQEDFPVPSELEEVLSTRRPRFSDVFRDIHTDEDAVLLAVPIVASGGELKGVLAGMSTLESLVSVGTYSEVLEITAGSEGFAYLVDGQGRVIYHQDISQLGTSLAATEPVVRATAGETGAVLSGDPTGEDIISGFAPLPDTDVSIDWAVITQEKWRDVAGPIRDRTILLLGLLVSGGVLTGGVIFLTIGRCLKPVRELTRGVQRVAGGDFDHTIEARSSDEIQDLAQQFNMMAGALKESYGGLEQKVSDRTAELGQSEERYRALFEESRDAIFVSDADGKIVAVNRAALDLFGFTMEEAIGSDVGDRYVDPGDRDRFRELIWQTGSVREFEVKLQKRSGTEIDCLMTATRRVDQSGRNLGVQGVIRDLTERKKADATLLEQTREVAVLEERNRMAREIHDTLAQGFTGIVLQLEAGEQVLDESPSELRNHLGRAKSLARDSLQEARRSVWDLLPKALEQLPLREALQEEVRRKFDESDPGMARFSVSGLERQLPSDIQTALLRVCQESLANIARHARATEVTVELTFHSDAVHLGIRDNGVGFDVGATKNHGPQSGFGLTGMEQRAGLLRGSVTVTSVIGQGTEVGVRIPT